MRKTNAESMTTPLDTAIKKITNVSENARLTPKYFPNSEVVDDSHDARDHKI